MQVELEICDNKNNLQSSCEQSLSKNNPLKEIFAQEVVSFLELIQIQDLQKWTKLIDDNLTQKILKHHSLLKQLMDCALRPHKIQPQKIKIQWPFRAIEFLTHQEENFYRSFFVIQITNIGQKEANSPIKAAVEGTQLLHYMFQILQQMDPLNQTSAGYLLRLFNQIYYQNQQQFFYYLVRHCSLMSTCLNHFYNSSIQQLLWRVIDTYNEDISSKALLMNTIFSEILIPKPYLSECLENLQIMLNDLLEKSEEINTRKISSLLFQKIINLQNLELIKGLVELNDDRNILKHLTNILCSFVNFFVYQKTPKKQHYNMQDSFQIISITEQILKKIIQLIKLILQHWFNIYLKSQSKQSKLPSMVLLNSILNLQPSKSSELISPDFGDLVIIIFGLEPSNNILHNQIKGVLEKALENQKIFQAISPKLIKFIVDKFSVSKKQQTNYLNQLYHIALILQQKDIKTVGQELLSKWNSFAQGDFKRRKQLYEYSWRQTKESSNNRFFGMQQQVLSEEEIGDVIAIKKYSQEIDLFPFRTKLEFSPTVELNSHV